MTAIITVKSVTTNKLHRSYEGMNITFCNHSGQRRMSRVVPVGAEWVEKAPDEMFCRKCFTNGKPK